jgi:serine/threonine protein kinase
MTDSNAIGPYRIIALLKDGGMGVVYRARRIDSDRVVALKTVRVPNPRWLEGIRREIHALTQIRHPGVVGIIEHGIDQGLPWYSMDLLEGETLAQYCRRIWSRFRRVSEPPVSPTEQVSATEGDGVESVASPMHSVSSVRGPRAHSDGPAPAAAGELRDVLRIMRRVCATLAFLHGEGFVNCDVKPDNIVLLNGAPVIIDFGLAAQHPGRSGREAMEAQRTAGTPPYMSPEQVRGELLDARSDLYAIGCVLYELVTGSPPFVGPPVTIRTGHLHQPPLPPSEIVGDIPRELERVILKLLDKDLTGRFGYADEVATLLANLSEDVQRLPDFPPTRSYLYRPRLVGRDSLMKELVGLRERAADGSGSLVLLAGESGVGKTRIAMEVTRVLSGARMLAVTSESSSLLSEAGGGAAPLQAVRPLLQAVADRCQEGGATVTERLLGERRSVLAQYEPLLAHVPADGPLAPPLPLAADASRRRLFTYLAETLSAFAHEQPVLWVIDDLGWADELSLSFLQSLTAEYLEATPAFLLCAYRSEEATDAVTAIAKLGHVKHLTVSRLDKAAVSAMVADMLATSDSTDGFVEFVERQAEGNPFFVTEYLRGAIGEHLLYRDSRNLWRLGSQAINQPELPLPGSLRELIEQRLARLSPSGQVASVAASVLGREAELALIREVTGLSDETTLGAVDELVRRQVMDPVDDGRVRFAHDKLREVAYARAQPDRLAQFHERAGLALERRYLSLSDTNLNLATVGHHFASAQRAERAAHYFKLAADRSRAANAHPDALRLYVEALKQLDRSTSASSEDAKASESARLALHEAIGDLLALKGAHEDARESFQKALGLGSIGAVATARLYRKQGKTWEAQHRHQDALRLHRTALGDLGEKAHESGDEERAEWIQINVDLLRVHYWLGDIQSMEAIVSALRPIIETHGYAVQKVRFYHALLQWMYRRDRYIICEEALGYAKAAIAAASSGKDLLEELPLTQFLYGFTLLFHGSLDIADRELRRGVDLARRAGDMPQQARALTYLTLAARRRGQVEEVRDLASQSLRVSEAAGMKDYIASALANEAWAALHEERYQEAEAQATAARDQWISLAQYPSPFQWMAALPLLKLFLLRDAPLRDAIGCAEIVLAPTQQPLPAAAMEALTDARTSWSRNEEAATRSSLKSALAQLERVPGYV